MTLFQMEVLVAVTESGSFTRAGEKIGLSQSGVSHTISALEKELGIFLFVRNRSGVKLTAAGEEVTASARTILEQTALIKKVAAQTTGLQQATIRIGSFPSVTANLLPQLLKSFHTLYPQMEMRLFEGSYQEIKQWLHTGVVDVGFHVWPEDGLEGVMLKNDSLKAVLPIDHPLAKESFLTLKQLAGEPFIMPMAGCELLIGAEFLRSGLQPQTMFEVADNATILAMVEAGVGVTVIPTLTLPTSLRKVAVLDLSPPLSRQIGLAVRSLTEASPAVLAFLREAQRIAADL
ncbi:LysR family transcriptional regulator [Brevibacillus sp. NRS-1366]|uniref:LysR family transcriptional regulator n=1 Tax=Brevibacillus sp. NRS-1366 TaxID=3233899 RepID=UPI003D1A8EF9